MTRLNQIVAISKGVKNKAERSLTDLHRKVQLTGPMSGISRTYRPRQEDGDQLPRERTLVQYTAEDINNEVVETLTRLYDVVATQDFANTDATADVKLEDGTVLVSQAPTTYLLFLEKQLANLATYVAKIPTLDPAERWTHDPATGVWRTEDTQTAKTKKVPKNHELSPATDKHPAQVQMYMEDVVVGDWTTVKFSGAITEDRRRQLMARVEEVRKAVQFAREEANTMEVTDVKVGETILAHIFTA